VNAFEAVLPVFTGSPTTKVEAPKRTVSPQCQWDFANISNFISITEYEGSECPYRRLPEIGFATTTIDPINDTDEIATFEVNPLPNPCVFTVSDALKIDDEIFQIISIEDDTILTCERALLGTGMASHEIGADVFFANCQKSKEACLRRGMYGNNDDDQFLIGGSIPCHHNYFGGFPAVTGQIYGRFRDKSGSKARWNAISFAGNESAYGKVLSLLYGHCRIVEPTVIIARNEGDFLIALFAVSEGVLATNPNNSAQASSIQAYVYGGTSSERIFVNGKPRHDFRPGVGILCCNGMLEQIPPSYGPFFSTIEDFSNYELAYPGTSWLVIRINQQDNPNIDVLGGDLTGDFEVQYGKCVRVYTTPTGYPSAGYDYKPTTSPVWVLYDFMTSRRSGGAIDRNRINIGANGDLYQSFLGMEAYRIEEVTDVINGGQVPRWTFNGAIDNKKPYAEHERMLCMGMYCLPPYIDADGKYKIRPLKAEALTDLPAFSSTSTIPANRNIIMGSNGVYITKSRMSVLDLPNEIRLNQVCYENGEWIKTQLVLSDDALQKQIGVILGDGSLRVVSKSVDLPGTMTLDEAARLGTLILRAGEFAAGGTMNNLAITFDTFYKTSANLELGDIVTVEDDQLDADTEKYFRVIGVEDTSQDVEGGGFLFTRKITATLHDNAIYDDTAYTITKISRLGYNSGANPGNPTGASGLTVLTTADDLTIPADRFVLQWNRDTSYYRTIEGVMGTMIESPETITEGPFSEERLAHPSNILEPAGFPSPPSCSCTVVRGSQHITVDRASNPDVLGKVFCIFTSDLSPDSDLDGNIIIEQGEDLLVVDKVFERAGTFKYVIMREYYNVPADSGNAWAQWFPIDTIIPPGGSVETPVWRTPPIRIPHAGTFSFSLYSRNPMGVGTRITAGPITLPVKEGVPDNLYMNAIPIGLDVLIGCMARKWNGSIYQGELRCWFVDTDKPDHVDLRTVAEGGTFADDGTTKRIFTGLGANYRGFQKQLTSPDQGRWYFAGRLRNIPGWSVWSDGNDTPEFVTDYVDTEDPALVDTGPPEDWEIAPVAGPFPGTAIVKVSRPKINGFKILDVVFQVKDASEGAWRALDADAGAAETKYDGSPTDHVYDKINGTISKEAGDWGTAAIGDLILFDVRDSSLPGWSWDKQWCLHGIVEGIDGLTLTGLFGFRPIFAPTDNVYPGIRVRIVKPEWTWDSEGYIAATPGNGISVKTFWTEGQKGDISTQLFESDPITLPDGLAIEDVQARVWFGNVISRSDDDYYSPSGNAYSDFLDEAIWLDGTLSPIPTDASLGCIFEFELSADRVLDNPVNAKNGQPIIWRLTQTAGGNHILTLGSKFRQGDTIPVPAIASEEGRRSYLGVLYNKLTDNYDVVAVASDYSDTISLLSLVAVSSGDTDPDYLESKLVAGTGITIEKENVGENEDLKISATGGVPTSRTIDTTFPLTGGGDLSENRTFAIDSMYMPRERLSAGRTYYVRTDGNDANDGSANDAAHAFLTIQHGVNIAKALDFDGYTVTIQIADGTYAADPVLILGFVTFGVLQLNGNAVTPANVHISPSAGWYAISVNACITRVLLYNFKLTPYAYEGIYAINASWVEINNLVFGAASDTQIYADGRSYVYVSGNYTVIGGGGCHWTASTLSYINTSNITVTFSTNPTAYSSSFALAYRDSVILCTGMTFTNKAYVTGKRYDLRSCSSCESGGVSDYLPGNSAGTAVTGGQYY
jgi:hypothetical protein